MPAARGAAETVVLRGRLRHMEDREGGRLDHRGRWGEAELAAVDRVVGVEVAARLALLARDRGRRLRPGFRPDGAAAGAVFAADVVVGGFEAGGGVAVLRARLLGNVDDRGDDLGAGLELAFPVAD